MPSPSSRSHAGFNEPLGTAYPQRLLGMPVGANMVAYEPVGWLKPQPKPVKAPKPSKPPSRKSLETKLRKLQREAEQLREKLKKRPED